MRENIYLIGPMGVGKTTIGRHLAKKLKLKFIDSDQEIEKRTGADISLIFDVEGESGFRDREENMIKELAQNHGVVIATGGGVILREANRHSLKQSGVVIYLNASIEVQLSRTQASKNRPLLQTADRRSAIEALNTQRRSLYFQAADLVIDTDGKTANQVANEIATNLKSMKK